jgi:predicted small metal-binding protein
MKQLDCPIEGCHATIEAETEREVMTQAETHASSAHPELELTDETIENIRSKIRDV